MKLLDFYLLPINCGMVILAFASSFLQFLFVLPCFTCSSMICGTIDIVSHGLFDLNGYWDFLVVIGWLLLVELVS